MSHSLNNPPAHDEIELSIFGPGRGESVAVHVGLGDWMIVDSCVDQLDSTIPALEYLRRIGVDLATQVRYVVGTHAHDDHIAGLATVLETCTEATFLCSSALTHEEFFALAVVDRKVEALLRRSSYGEYRRILDIVRSRGLARPGWRPLRRALERLELPLPIPSDGLHRKVLALTPSDEAVTRSLSALAGSVPRPGENVRLPKADPNELAVALWIEVGRRAILLGADLPIGPMGCGWQGVLEWFKPEVSAEAIKVPHHGAPNAHHEGVWSDLLGAGPVAVLAPYRAGRTPRPAPPDRSRICGLTPHAYTTASSDRVPPPRSVRRTAATISQVARSVREPWGKSGHVRARANANGGTDWTVDYSWPARLLCGPLHRGGEGWKFHD